MYIYLVGSLIPTSWLSNHQDEFNCDYAVGSLNHKDALNISCSRASQISCERGCVGVWSCA